MVQKTFFRGLHKLIYLIFRKKQNSILNMTSLVSLIIALFTLLITVLILVLAGIAILLVLIIFFFISIIVGIKQQSILKGLKVFMIASMMLIITPISALFFKFNLASTLDLTMQQGLWVGAVVGAVVSLLFSLLSYKYFQKASVACYNFVNSKMKKLFTPQDVED